MKIVHCRNDCACAMAAVTRGQCARNRGCSTAQANRGGGLHRTPLTPKVEIIDDDYDVLAGAISKAGLRSSRSARPIARCTRDLFSHVL